MENVSVPTRWPPWNTPKEPASIFCPSCSFSLGAAPAATHQTNTNMKASSRQNKDNFTVILLFLNDRQGLETNQRPRSLPETARYAQSPRKEQPGPCPRLRWLLSPWHRSAAVAGIDQRTLKDLLFARVVSLRPPGCAAKVRPGEHPEI